MPLKKYREKKRLELEEYRGEKARGLKGYRGEKARELKEYRGEKARELKEYREKKRLKLEEYRDKKARERKAYEGYGDNDKLELGTLGPTVAESGLNNLGMYPMDAPKNGSFGTPARKNFEDMKKGGKVNKKKSYSRGGKVRGVGRAVQKKVRLAKMIKMKGS
jgi:hypothetical protein